MTSLEIGVAPLFIVLTMLFQQKQISIRKWIISFGTLLACFVLIYGVVNGDSGVVGEFSVHMVIGLMLSVLCGIGAIYCAEYSRALNDIGWTSSMILSKRYYAVIFVSFIVTYDSIIPYFLDNIWWIVAVTISGVIAPNYLLQKGIQYTNTFVVMMLLGFIPVFTFIFQLFDERLQFSAVTFIGVVVLFVMGLLSIREER